MLPGARPGQFREGLLTPPPLLPELPDEPEEELEELLDGVYVLVELLELFELLELLLLEFSRVLDSSVRIVFPRPLPSDRFLLLYDCVVVFVFCKRTGRLAAVLLSTSAAKLSFPAGGSESGRADFAAAFWKDAFANTSDVTLTTGDPRAELSATFQQGPGHLGLKNIIK